MEKLYGSVEKEQLMTNIKNLIAIIEDMETSMNGETQQWQKEKGA